jgi:UDP-GlcNAc:undecaprenyl-phosphate GlcNAc-1-phosphate transferase
MILVFIPVFTVSFILCMLLCPVFRFLAVRYGYVDVPDIQRKQHEQPVPYGGGLAVISSFFIVCAGLSLVSTCVPQSWFPAEIRIHLQGLRQKMLSLYMIGGGGAVLGLMGFIDDMRPVREIYKLLIQLGIGALMWWAGFRITAHIPLWPVSLVITVFWIAGISNSFNFLDNMDGLSTGVAFIVSLLFAMFGLQTGQLFVAGYFLIIAGCSLGFLVFNFPPASLFLGDCGSLFLGFLISMGAVVSTFSAPDVPNRIMPLLVPIIICSLPIFDTVSVMTIRIFRGKPLLKGDRNHFSHRLLRLGMEKKTVLFTIYLVVAGVGLSSFYLIRLTAAESFLPLIQAVCVFSIIVLLERAGGKRDNG